VAAEDAAIQRGVAAITLVVLVGLSFNVEFTAFVDVILSD
jgi:hypothetical protein